MNAIPIVEPRRRAQGVPLFSAGFRPFFLGASLYAAFGAVGWVFVWHGHVEFSPALPAALWHGHEMLFGFAGSALAGFLLTAVPNWTGAPPLSGMPLGGLFAVWVAGRVAAWTVAVDAPLLFAALDAAFLPLLALTVGPAIFRASMPRNAGALAVLCALWLANLAMHAQSIGWFADTARTGLLAGVDLMALLVALIGGRIVPAFTRNALTASNPDRALAIRSRRPLEILAIGSLAVSGIATLLELSDPVRAALLALASIAGFVRLAQWGGRWTFREPLLWGLHLGYAWLCLGLALRALAAATGAVPESMGIHAITLGAFGTMIVSVMCRASLGHSGRPVRGDRWTAAALFLVSAATIGRALVGPLFPGAVGLEVMGLSGAVWASAFALFALRYGAILLRPRADSHKLSSS
ncbi:MAG: NnrS family protein [Tagaea sp.]|nr:NnrS family protein [Tagaea sp.]